MILNIKHLMGDLGLTQNDIANIIGEYQSVVSLFVQGKRYPMDRHIEALEKAYGKDVVAKYFVEEADIDFNIGRTGRVELKRLMGDFDLSQRQMAEIMGTTQSEVSQLSNGNRKFMRKHTDALIAHFGEDVIKKYTLPADAYEPKVREAKVTSVDAEIVEEAKDLGREEVRSGDVIHKEGEQNSDVIYSIPFIDKTIATAPDINIRRLVQEKAHTLEEFPFYKMVKDVDYIQTVITMAMAPRYLPGDFLFIRFRDGQVLSGKIYLVDTKTYGTMLRLVYIEEGGYVLKAFNPEFKSVFVKSEDVYSISSVVLSVNTNTSLTSDVDLASLVKSRDAQIISLQKTQDAFIEQQQSLIDEIRKQNERLDEEHKRNNALVDKIINKE